MHEPPRCYNVTITVSRDGGQLPDPVRFGAAADRAAWCRSASIVSAHTADKIISVVTVHAPDRFAAEAIARAVVFDALRSSPGGDGPASGGDGPDYRGASGLRGASGQLLGTNVSAQAIGWEGSWLHLEPGPQLSGGCGA